MTTPSFEDAFPDLAKQYAEGWDELSDIEFTFPPGKRGDKVMLVGNCETTWPRQYYRYRMGTVFTHNQASLFSVWREEWVGSECTWETDVYTLDAYWVFNVLVWLTNLRKKLTQRINRRLFRFFLGIATALPFDTWPETLALRIASRINRKLHEV
jgi:hypothetical protein